MLLAVFFVSQNKKKESMLKEFVTVHMNRFGVICMSDSILAPPIEKLPWPIIISFLHYFLSLKIKKESSLKEFVTIHMKRFGVICMSDSVLAPPIEKLPWPIITCFLQQAPSQLLLTHSHISPQIFQQDAINFLIFRLFATTNILQYFPNIANISGSD